MGRHKHKILSYKNERVEIDEDMVPLISNMWKLGINTTNCCQGQCKPFCKHGFKHVIYKDRSTHYKKIMTKHCHKYIWVVFDQAKDVELFYNYVAEYNEKRNSMYGKMHGRYEREDSIVSGWHLEVFPVNRGEKKVIKKTQAVQASGLKKGTFQYYLEDAGCGTNNFNMMIQLYFPRAHLPYVVERIKSALKKSKR